MSTQTPAHTGSESTGSRTTAYLSRQSITLLDGIGMSFLSLLQSQRLRGLLPACSLFSLRLTCPKIVDTCTKLLCFLCVSLSCLTSLMQRIFCICGHGPGLLQLGAELPKIRATSGKRLLRASCACALLMVALQSGPRSCWQGTPSNCMFAVHQIDQRRCALSCGCFSLCAPLWTAKRSVTAANWLLVGCISHLRSCNIPLHDGLQGAGCCDRLRRHSPTCARAWLLWRCCKVSKRGRHLVCSVIRFPAASDNSVCAQLLARASTCKPWLGNKRAASCTPCCRGTHPGGRRS